MSGNRSTPERDLAEYVNNAGHIAVDVTISKPGTPRLGHTIGNRETGASAEPRVIAGFLRELADDVERVDSPDTGESRKDSYDVY